MAPTEHRPRHLWLALLPVLLLSVWALSCGDPPDLPCQAYCSGCCTAEGVCLSTASQTNATCGAAGALCAACESGTSCVSGFCSDGTGADCGASGQACCTEGIACSRGLTCEGNVCVAPACGGEGEACCGASQCDGDLQCRDGTCRAEACGGSGQTCCPGAACTGGLTCAAGICGGSGGTAQIGASCAANSECQLNQCRTPSAGWPAGYCTAGCNSNAACPGDSLCVGNPFNLGLGNMCLDACDDPGTQSTCRSGYVCERSQHRPGNPGVCIPRCDTSSGTLCRGDNVCNPTSGLCAGDPGYGCKPDGTCNNGGACGPDGFCPTTVNPYGGPCTASAQCPGGLCIAQTNAGWTSGYCSGPCKLGETSCDPGGGCSVFFEEVTQSNYCLAECVFDGGRGSCREGYVCERGLTDVPGQTVCAAPCQSDTECPTGQSCNAQGLCD